MSQAQKDSLDTMLRGSPLDLGGAVEEQRAIFDEMMSHIPAVPGVRTTPRTVGGVDALALEVDGAERGSVILYLHGGAFAIGTAAASVPLAGDLARRARTHLITVDYRLAPEHPFPAGLDDALAAYTGLLEEGTPPSQIVLAGESAGAGLVASVLISLRDRGLALPAAALLMSPWGDLTLSGDSMATKQALDPAVTATGLGVRVGDYTAGADAAQPLISPVLADLTGLPPLLIQVGSHEILLSDATALAAAAGATDVAVTLEIVPGVPHVFQSFAAVLDEGSAALDRAAAFLFGHMES